ncbi:MAG: type II secretion system protein N [Paracoccaceae bacterium]
MIAGRLLGAGGLTGLGLALGAAALDGSALRVREPGPEANAPEPAAPAETGRDFSWTAPGSPLAEAWRRPLFARDRRPGPAPGEASQPTPAATPAAADDRPPEISLLGVFQAGARASALLSTDASDAPRWVALGEAYAGATLVAIHADRVALRSAGRVRSILLRRAAPFPE